MIRFELNGAPVEVADAPPTRTLLEWLREERITGTKEGCAEGDCGACTVALLDEAAAPPRWRAVDSCLVLLPMLHGRRVVTVEGLARDGALHPVQRAMVDALGSQCGFCTPGFVMTLFEACYRPDLDAPWKLGDQLCGNLCRCTGYRPIREAARAVAGTRPADAFRAATEAPPVAPPAVEHRAHAAAFHAPTALDEALALLAADPPPRIVCGGTDLALDVTMRGIAFPALLSIERIPELRGVAVDGDRVRIGAATPLVDLEDWSADGLPVLHRMLRYFGSRQIKHRATLGGNLCNASPIGDLAPVLLALDATLVARGPAGERRVPIDAFFVGYRRTALEPGELLAAVELVRPAPGVRLGAYKVSRRRELDISAVSAAMAVKVAGGSIVEARIAYGGMAATPARARRVEDHLRGAPWTETAIEGAAAELSADFRPLDDHRGTAAFRSRLARQLLLGFFAETRDRDFVPLPAEHVGTVVAG